MRPEVCDEGLGQHRKNSRKRNVVYCERIGFELFRQARLRPRTARNSLPGFEHGPQAETEHGGKAQILAVRSIEALGLTCTAMSR